MSFGNTSGNCAHFKSKDFEALALDARNNFTD
jgi:hypothetical protein